MTKQFRELVKRDLKDIPISEQIEMIEVYGCLSDFNNIKKSYANFIVSSYGIGKARDLKGNFECEAYDLELLNQIVDELNIQIGRKPNNENLPIILEVISVILNRENYKNVVEYKNNKVLKYSAKEYALAYIFDLFSKGQQIPINRKEATLDAKYLKSIGEEKTKGNFKGDTFYRAVKEVKNYNLNDIKELNLISNNWKNAVLAISKNDNEIKKYFSNQNL